MASMTPHNRLARAFFQRPTRRVAHNLLGSRLVRLEPDGARTAGVITECEAYIGQEDLGCHARSGRTERNQSMWGPPGHAYVYFTYGMHWMLNVVTEADGVPAAVLIRGMWPTEGIERMRGRRDGREITSLADGPAKICQALQIDGSMDGADLCVPQSDVFFEQGIPVADRIVTTGPRVGLNSVPEPWKSVPWRFYIPDDHIQTWLREEMK